MSSNPQLSWSRDATMRYLNARPLPRSLTWPHRDGGDLAPWPVHGSVIGYGKWLRETPYFPGLFELCHDLLADAPEQFAEDWLPAELTRRRTQFTREPDRPGEALAHKIRRLLPASNQSNFL